MQYNAINTFKNYKDAWKKMVVRAMRVNFSWEKSASKYVDVFKVPAYVSICQHPSASVSIRQHPFAYV
jgi:glycogen synthase